MNKLTKPQLSTDSRILKSIRRRGRGSVFVPVDFLEFGSREAVDVVLHRLSRSSTIRRLARGIYDYPKKHRVLSLLQPSAESVAQAIAGRDRSRLQPAGAYAANLLGLSEQVPARSVFLTDGPSKKVKIGKQTIELRRTTLKNMATAGRMSGLLIQALREIGKEHISTERVNQLKQAIPLKDRQRLLKDIRFAPAWMHPIFRELAAEVK